MTCNMDQDSRKRVWRVTRLSKIRFNCEKCQRRLSVSSECAGRSAVCPKCKQRITIPSIKAADTVPLHMTVSDGHDLLPEMKSKLSVQARPQRPHETEAARTVQSDFTLDKPVPLKILGAGHPVHDHPDKVWCVRDRDRKADDPISAARLWEMVQNGELNADAMIWREDWDDWFVASAVFPELQDDRAKRKPTRGAMGAGKSLSDRLWQNLPAILGVMIAIAIIVFLTVVILIVANS